MRLATHHGGGGGDPAWAAFEVAFRRQLDAWLAVDDARRAGTDPTLLGTLLDELSTARNAAAAARRRLGHA